MKAREIITLQIGTFSNYIGAHYWNLQDEYVNRYGTPGEETEECRAEINPECLFRRGTTPLGYATITPRLVSIDLTGALGCMPEAGFLYGAKNKSAAMTWQGKVQVSSMDSIASTATAAEISQFGNFIREDESKHEITPLRKSIDYWTDYLNLPLHAKSCISMPNHKLGFNDFELYSDGVEAANENFIEESFDRVRFFSEECDSLQGFQVVFDSDNSFAGVAKNFLEYIKEEFSVPIFTIAASNCPENVEEKAPYVNRCIADNYISEISSLYTPVFGQKTSNHYFPEFVINQSNSMFESSSVLASAWHLATTPTRLYSNKHDFSSMIDKIRPFPEMKFATLKLALPLGWKDPSNSHRVEDLFSLHYNIQRHTNMKDPHFVPLFGSNLYSNLSFDIPLFVKGFENNLCGEFATVHGASKCFNGKEHRNNVIKDVFENYMYSFPALSHDYSYLNEPLAVPKSFPSSFDDSELSSSTDIFTCFSTKFALKKISKNFSKARNDSQLLNRYIKNGDMSQDEFIALQEKFNEIISVYSD